MPDVSHRFTEAVALAAHVHAGHVRKGTGVPYFAHVLSVSALVLGDGGDEDEAIAALLHDALEDHPDRISREDITARFGARVRALVEVCTDTPPDYAGGKKPPWHERKRTYIAHVRATPAADLRVSVADKLDNARAMLHDHHAVGDDLWERFSAGRDDQLWYYRSLVTAYRESGVTSPLLVQLERVVEALAAAAP